MYSIVSMAGGQAIVLSKPKPEEPDRENEDQALALALGEAGVLIVADGVGGHPQGAKASRITVEVMQRTLEGRSEDRPLRDAILDGFEQANAEILKLSSGAATTLAMVELIEDDVRTYHAGDSMIMVVGQRGRQKLLTVPHSPVGYQVEAGLLGAEEALFHEDLSLVSNFVGSAEMRVEVGSRMPLAPRDTVVVGSDGLFDNMRIEEIGDVVRTGPLEEAAQELMRICEQRMTAPQEGHPSKPDDLSFVLYRRN